MSEHQEPGAPRRQRPPAHYLIRGAWGLLAVIAIILFAVPALFPEPAPLMQNGGIRAGVAGLNNIEIFVLAFSGVFTLAATLYYAFAKWVDCAPTGTDQPGDEGQGDPS